MIVYEDGRVRNWVHRQMMNKVGGVREGPLHISELTQCARKTILARRSPVDTPAEDLVKYAIGYAIQEYVLGPEADSITAMGVKFSADKAPDGRVLEFKSTALSYHRKRDDYHFDPTEHREWVERSACYCVAYDCSTVHFIVYFLFARDIHAWTVEYNDEELALAQYCIEARKNYIEGYLDGDEIPPPEPDWYCDNCYYKRGDCNG